MKKRMSDMSNFEERRERYAKGAEALRAVDHRVPADGASWEPGQSPWVRIRGDDEPFYCYLCGEREAFLSSTDWPSDHGRVTVYCDGRDCDARETEVIVMRDGTTTTPARADVQVMQKFAPMETRPTSEQGPGRDWATGTPPSVRTKMDKVFCLFCGDHSCSPARDDVADDNGRIRLQCTNSRCRASQIEVLVIRDNTRWTRRRSDVKGLEDIRRRRA